MKTCCFFGHSNDLACKYEKLVQTIEDVINIGYKKFLVGDHGLFDFYVINALVGLKEKYDIQICRVMTSFKKLTSLEKLDGKFKRYEFKMYDVENLFYKRIISVTNQKMVDESDLIICCVNSLNQRCGALKAVRYAERKNKKIINLFNTNM